MLGINLKRRAREKRIADEVMDAFMGAAPINGAYPNEMLAHHIGLVCQRLEWTPTDASMGRVLSYVSKMMVSKSRVQDKMIVAVDKASSKLEAAI